MEQMSVEQFGATVKAKYPQYSKFSDTEIGQKMVQKYPQYQNKIKKETNSGVFDTLVKRPVRSLIARPAVRFGELVGNVALTGVDKLSGGKLNELALKRTGETLQSRLQKVTEEDKVLPMGLGTIKGVRGGISGVKQIAGEALETGADLASLYGGGGLVSNTLKGKIIKGAAQGVISGAGAGFGYGAGDVLQEGGTVKEAAKQGKLEGVAGGIFGGVIGGALPVVSKAVSATVKNANPAAIMQRVARISKAKQIKFEQTAKESVGQYLTKRGIYGNIDEISTQLYNRFNQSKTTADNALATMKGKFKPEPIKTALDELLTRETAISTPGAMSKDLKVVDSLLKKYNSVGLDMSEINTAKRLYEKNVKLDYLKQNLPQSVAKANNIDNAIRTWQDNQAKKLGLKNLPEINRETRLARQLLDDLGKEYSGAAGNNAITLTDWVMLSGGDPTAIAGFLTKKTLSSKGVQSSIAKLLAGEAKIGAPSAKIGEKQAGSFGEFVKSIEGRGKQQFLPQSQKVLEKSSSNIVPQKKRTFMDMLKSNKGSVSVPNPLYKDTKVIKLTDEIKESISKELANYDDKVLSARSKNFAYAVPEDTIDRRITELKNKNEIKSLNDQEYKEVYDLLKAKGVDAKPVDKVLPKKPAFKQNPTTGRMEGSKGTAPKVLPYKEKGDITTKLLKDMEGKTTVSKTYIQDATNRPEVKQVEKDLIRELLKNEPDTVNVAKFAEKVKAELLPLKTKSSDVVNPKFDQYSSKYMQEEGSFSSKYDSVALPKELRGKVENYKENIYESPVATKAGDTHFEHTSKNYFGHTRIEDMADNKTRRVIEVQSDLYQKGNLERESNKLINRMTETERKVYDKLDAFRNNGEGTLKQRDEAWAKMSKLRDEAEKRPGTPNKKLAQYNDPTAHFRMIREEIKKAAQDGKTKLQFPTGETAMKIEGLGETANFYRGVNTNLPPVKAEDLKVGMEVYERGDNQWIITDVLGDGKFKAVPKSEANLIRESMSSDPRIGTEKIYLDNLKSSRQNETFDISGKVDTNNPIYKFYEKEVQKYLNKFGGKKVVDDKGVSWIELDIKKDYGNLPVEAFSFAPILPLAGQEDKDKKKTIQILPKMSKS